MWFFGCFGFNDFFGIGFEFLLIGCGELRLWPDIQLRAGLGPKGTEEVRLRVELRLLRRLEIRVESLLPRRCNLLVDGVGKGKKDS